ncbi:XRE family transcriptional regulator, partial [Campylobacter jejuni]|nr:XRE family transcriptional regulator [Campylobacter jejuni]
MNISQKIKNAREAKNLTQLELAKSSGVSLDSI